MPSVRLDDIAGLTLGEALRRMALQRPESPALLSEGPPLSWSALDAAVDAAAARLYALGIRPGDVVGCLLTKRPEVVIAFLALARLGALFAPVNWKLRPAQINDQLVNAQIRALLVESATAEESAALDAGPLRISVEGEGPGWLPWSAPAPPLPPLPAVSAEAPCYLNYTSGTTGRPKGAITTHRQILVNAVLTILALDVRGHDVFLGMFSVFSHPHELFHRCLLTGGPFVILDTLSPRVVTAAVARHRVTWMMAVPSFYEMMSDHRGPGVEATASLRVLESGGAPITAEALARLEAAFPGATFLPVWGCTEATGVAIANTKPQRRPGATGKAVPGYQLRLVDDHGRDVATGEVGELWIAGEAVVEGYCNQPAETADLFSPGGYNTRDLLRQDADGYYWFVGRRSEMLKIGGIRVYPLEIEAALLAHPEVRDAVVVRAEERVRGEIARAVVELRPGSTADARALRAWCRDRLAVYMVPRIVEIWAALPRLPNGKLDKRAVAEAPPDPERHDRP